LPFQFLPCSKSEHCAATPQTRKSRKKAVKNNLADAVFHRFFGYLCELILIGWLRDALGQNFAWIAGSHSD